MTKPVTVTRYATWTAIHAVASEISLDDVREAVTYWSGKEAPHRIIRIDATLTEVTEEMEDRR